ncbi:unnamed protein product [Closterium sp. Naga37s-1]|nr:unnamed protein product [Closterium sp. Naga37s-1]
MGLGISSPQTDYFERSYPGGWFTYGAILDSRVEASDLPALISSRERNHMPAFITAYAIASPRPLVYFSILWQPNSKSVGWVVVFNLDGQMFQDSLHRRIASGFKPHAASSSPVLPLPPIIDTCCPLLLPALPPISATHPSLPSLPPNSATRPCRPTLPPVPAAHPCRPSLPPGLYLEDLAALTVCPWTRVDTFLPSPLISSHHPSSPPITPHLLPSPLISSHHPSSPPITPHLLPSPLISSHHPSSPPITPHLLPSPLISSHHPSSPLITPHLLSSPLISSHPPSSPLISSHPPSSPLISSHPPPSPLISSHPPPSPLISSHPPSSPLISSHPSSSPLISSHPPSSPLISSHPPSSPLISSHPPSSPLISSHPSSSPLISSHPPSSPLISSHPPSSPLISSHPPSSPLISSHPSSSPLISSHPSSSPLISSHPPSSPLISSHPPQGFSPLSVSLTEDPAALTVYVADVWSSPPSSGGWLGGVAMTELELQQALAQLPPPLVPTFLKAYTVGMQVFYAYVARPPSSTAPHLTLTADISRSGFELLARSLSLFSFALRSSRSGFESKMGPRAANILTALFSLALLAAALPRRVSSSPAFRGGFGAELNLRGPVAAADENLPRRNVSGGYFERKYPGGWLTAGPILDSRVESSDLPALLSSRTRSHVPAFVSAYAVASPRPLVFFSVLWQPNSKSLGWVMVFNLNGQQYQDALRHYISSGYKPSQVESYYVADHHGLYYAAIFLADVAWPAGSSTRVEAVFGVPHDSAYCCGPSSRWLQLQRQGFTPLSVAFTEDPSSQRVYVADVWNDAPSRGGWQGGVAKTQAQLQQALTQLLPPLVPTFLKAYTVGYQVFYAYIARASSPSPPHSTLTTDVSRSAFELLARSLKQPPLLVSPPSLLVPLPTQVFYAYIARAATSSPPRSTLTTDVSRSAFELLARSLKQPPLLVSSYGPMDGGPGGSDAPGSGERPMDGGAGERNAPGSGERYAVLWQTDGLDDRDKQPPLLVSSYGPMDGGAGESDAPGSGERYAVLWQTDGVGAEAGVRENVGLSYL